MGYRLHARIPNVEEKNMDRFIELGKQYEEPWYAFNDKWFGEGKDGAVIEAEDLDDFLIELKETNKKVEVFELYNLEQLEEMINFAKEKDYVVQFESF